jgi:hypothetical protein
LLFYIIIWQPNTMLNWQKTEHVKMNRNQTLLLVLMYLYVKDTKLYFKSTCTIIVCWNKMKNKKYHTVRTIPKSNIKILERGKINTP